MENQEPDTIEKRIDNNLWERIKKDIYYSVTLGGAFTYLVAAQSEDSAYLAMGIGITGFILGARGLYKSSISEDV